MIKYRTETKEEVIKTAEGVICDVCKKEFSCNDIADDMEIQEFQYIHLHGGYASVFGDGSVVEAAICQHCLKKILGDYLVINADNCF